MSEEKQLECGMKVCLVSGGPVMTVNSKVDGSRGKKTVNGVEMFVFKASIVECVWFCDETLCKQTFHVKALVEVIT